MYREIGNTQLATIVASCVFYLDLYNYALTG